MSHPVTILMQALNSGGTEEGIEDEIVRLAKTTTLPTKSIRALMLQALTSTAELSSVHHSNT
jgi:hypothetical protein